MVHRSTVFRSAAGPTCVTISRSADGLCTAGLPHPSVQRFVLLSPGAGFTPMAKQFSLRGMLMLWFPTRFTVNSFMRWFLARVSPKLGSTTPWRYGRG